jgi:O-antigen/teichoic acid export membrane protein
MKIENNIKKIASSEFFKYSAALLSSNVIAQVIGILAYPLITRIYGREIFGEFNLFFSIAGILIILATGRYEAAIILPKSEKKAIALFQLCLILNVFLFFISLLVALLWKEEIASFFKIESLIRLLPFLPVFVLLGSFWLTLNYFYIRQKKYYNISSYNIVQSLVASILKCLFGIKGFIQSGLVWGTLCGQLPAIVVSFFKSEFPLKKIIKIDKSELANVAKTYSNFPKYELPNGLLNTFAGNLPILLLSVYFEMEEIGLFSLALTIGFRPVNLFCNSVYQTLFKKINERIHNKENIKRDLLLFCRTCVVTILPFFLLFLFISEWIFGILFGQEWRDAGFYLKLMLPWLFMIVVVASISFIPDLFFKQKMAMNLEIICVTFRTISLLTGIYFHDFRLAILLYCAVSALILGIKLIWYFRLVKKYETSLI